MFSWHSVTGLMAGFPQCMCWMLRHHLSYVWVSLGNSPCVLLPFPCCACPLVTASTYFTFTPKFERLTTEGPRGRGTVQSMRLGRDWRQGLRFSMEMYVPGLHATTVSISSNEQAREDHAGTLNTHIPTLHILCTAWTYFDCNQCKCPLFKNSGANQCC